jgi:hypothetical protein
MMARTVSLPVKLELTNAWVVQPGDKLVLAYAHRVSPADADAIKQYCAQKLPGVEIVIVDGLAHMAVYKPEELKVNR